MQYFLSVHLNRKIRIGFFMISSPLRNISCFQSFPTEMSTTKLMSSNPVEYTFLKKKKDNSLWYGILQKIEKLFQLSYSRAFALEYKVIIYLFYSTGMTAHIRSIIISSTIFQLLVGFFGFLLFAFYQYYFFYESVWKKLILLFIDLASTEFFKLKIVRYRSKKSYVR